MKIGTKTTLGVKFQKIVVVFAYPQYPFLFLLFAKGYAFSTIIVEKP